MHITSFSGLTISSSGTAETSLIPFDSSGKIPRFVRVAATAQGTMRVSANGESATADDNPIQPGDSAVVATGGCRYISFLSTSGKLNVSALESGGWNTQSQEEYLTGLMTSLMNDGTQGWWYEPSDFSTLFQDVAGTIPVTAVEQSVALMLDKSGMGNHAFQATAPSRPILRVDSNGCYYLDADGSDDGMATAAFAAGSDKLTVFAAVHKMSTAIQVPFEFSSSSFANANTFALIFGDNANANNVGFVSKGSASGYAITPAMGVNVTKVISGIGSISGDNSILRLNGVQVAQSTADQGTGNYGTYPLYLFRRGGTSLPFQGRFYGGAGKFRALSGAETSIPEQYLRMKSRAY